MSNKYENEDLRQLRICVQKFSPMAEEHLNKISRGFSTDISRSKLAAAFLKNNLWNANQQITIGFIDAPRTVRRTPLSDLKRRGMPLDPLVYTLDQVPIKQAIKTIVMERIQPLVNLKLVFVPDNQARNAMVRVAFKDDGAWSLVGTDNTSDTSGRATMNFGWFDVGTVMHEFCHMLGMIHEHQNPKGGIKWNVEKVYEWAKQTQGWSRETTYHNIIEKYSENQLNSSEFDKRSIMLYPFSAELTTNGVGTDMNMKLSKTDVIWLAKMYPGGEMTPAEFYKKIYNENLGNVKDQDVNDSKNNGDDSKNDSKDNGDNNTAKNNGNIGMIVAIVIFMMLLMYAVYLLQKSRKQ
jgi:hypothetical protein